MRFQGVPPEEEPQEGRGESRDFFIARIVHGTLPHPDRSRSIAEVRERSHNQYTPSSERSKEMIYSSGTVDGFEEGQLSESI